MIRHRVPGLVAWLAAIAAWVPVLAAQEPPAGTTPPAPAPQGSPPPAWVDLERYDVRASRAAFAACDRNGDDRLDLLEARRCLPGLGGDTGRAAFRRLDRDRDGFVHWPEFDARFRARTTAGLRFRFRPARPFTNPAPQAATLQRRAQATVDFVMELANADADPHLDREEFAGLLRALKQPPTAMAFFAALDADGSGSLSKAELRPVVARIPYLAQLAAQRPGNRARGGPAPKATLTAEQLQERLDRMHPLLGRWAARVFATADADGDGKLSGTELATKG